MNLAQAKASTTTQPTIRIWRCPHCGRLAKVTIVQHGDYDLHNCQCCGRGKGYKAR